MKLEYNFGFATLTSATSYTERYVMQSEDSTESLQNIFNTTHLVNGVYVANYIQSLYVEDDPTSQFAEEVRLTSKNSGALQWVGGLYYSKLDSGYITHNQEPGWVDRTVLRLCGRGSVPSPATVRHRACLPAPASCAIPILHYPLTPTRRQPIRTASYSTITIRMRS